MEEKKIEELMEKNFRTRFLSSYREDWPNHSNGCLYFNAQNCTMGIIDAYWRKGAPLSMEVLPYEQEMMNKQTDQEVLAKELSAFLLSGFSSYESGMRLDPLQLFGESADDLCTEEFRTAFLNRYDQFMPFQEGLVEMKWMDISDWEYSLGKLDEWLDMDPVSQRRPWALYRVIEVLKTHTFSLYGYPRDKELHAMLAICAIPYKVREHKYVTIMQLHPWDSENADINTLLHHGNFSCDLYDTFACDEEGEYLLGGIVAAMMSLGHQTYGVEQWTNIDFLDAASVRQYLEKLDEDLNNPNRPESYSAYDRINMSWKFYHTNTEIFDAYIDAVETALYDIVSNSLEIPIILQTKEGVHYLMKQFAHFYHQLAEKRLPMLCSPSDVKILLSYSSLYQEYLQYKFTENIATDYNVIDATFMKMYGDVEYCAPTVHAVSGSALADIIQNCEVERLLKVLHDKVDGKSGPDAALTIAAAKTQGYLTRYPMGPEYEAEFPNGPSARAVQNQLKNYQGVNSTEYIEQAKKVNLDL